SDRDWSSDVCSSDLARRNATWLRRDAGTFFTITDGGGLRVEPREHRTLPRATSRTVADRHRLRHGFDERDRRTREARRRCDSARPPRTEITAARLRRNRESES